MAPHSSTLAWKIPWTEEPGRLQSMGSLSWTRLSDFTFTFHFHALEKEMATHSSVLAWRIPGTREPGGLLSMGLHRVGHDWSDLAAAAAAAEAYYTNKAISPNCNQHPLEKLPTGGRDNFFQLWGILATAVELCWGENMKNVGFPNFGQWAKFFFSQNTPSLTSLTYK